MGWDSTHCISHGTYGTENDELEIENLLNKHSDSEYECQNAEMGVSQNSSQIVQFALRIMPLFSALAQFAFANR